MKKILFLLFPIYSVLCCNLAAQNINNDVLVLQKSNASLKSRLNEQNLILLKQIHTSDSILALLQVATIEIKKNADNQKNINAAVSKLQTQTSSTNRATADISNAFGKRKMYGLIAGIGFIILILAVFLFFRNKLLVLKSEVKQNDENVNRNVAQLNDFVDKELGELRTIVTKNFNDLNLVIEKQSLENKTVLSKQIMDCNDRIGKVGVETNRNIENQIQLVNEKIQDQISQAAKEFDKKIASLVHE